MSLRLRLAISIALVVLATLFVAWWLTGPAVFGPLRARMERAHAQDVAEAVRAAEDGRPAEEIRETYDFRLRTRRRRPGFTRGGHGVRHCRRLPMPDDRPAFQCRGPGQPTAVARNDGGWWVLRRPGPWHDPQRRLGGLVIALAVCVVPAALYLGGRLTRPLRTTARAMERVAAGELSHRLPESGGRELGDVARSFNRMTERVETLIHSEQALLAGVSHELRSPLARMRLQLALIRDEGRDADPTARLDALDDEITVMDQLLEDTLALSRAALSDERIAREDVDLEGLVREAAEAVDLSAHRLHTTGHAPALRGDPRQLKRALRNLLDNARKYSPAQSRILVSFHPDGFSVSDAGPGLSEAEMAHAFEPFYRGPRGDAVPGYGLGLMIVRDVIKAHGGRIHLQNRAEGGLEVRCRFSAEADDASPPC